MEKRKEGERVHTKKSLGLYLHIPFCLSKCRYCDFCSFAGATHERMTDYVRALCGRLEAWAKDCAAYEVNTVYFGGGTPTLLPIEGMAAIMDTLHAHYALSENCEITCECNPATADLSYLSSLRRMGINRLSIGLQSVHDEELRMLGRAHTYADFLATYRDARDAGFDNISVDLMYGLPDQRLERFCASLDTVAALSPEHLSAYGLKIEEGTPFFRMRDSLRLPDEDEEYAMYVALSERLSAHGYHKYEISNFAKDGRESRHNLRYWRGEEYLGFGPAAHSDFGGVRFGNARDLDGFLSGRDIVCESNTLTPHEREEEYVMLRLRLAEGIDLADFMSRTGQAFIERYPAVPALLRHGLMAEEGGRIFLTDRGFFVSNAILSELLDLEK